MTKPTLSRRAMLSSGALALGSLAVPGVIRAQSLPQYQRAQSTETVRHNMMGFVRHDWHDHFTSLRKGAILCDTHSRAVYFWSEDENTTLVYPTSVPMTEEFTRRGMTEVTLKRHMPTWIPTPNMRERDPSLPARVEGGDPKNPMGTRAMNLSWQYYRVHGIDDPAKVGRRASNGCFGLMNAHVEELFELVEVGTQVRVI